MTVHYEVAGRGFPLLLLPGAAADGAAWRKAGYVELLADTFACVMVDPPGMGRSAEPGDDAAFGVGAIASAVVEVADELGLERFAIWGASAGGSAGIVVAAEYPDRVAALVLSGAWPGDLSRWR